VSLEVDFETRSDIDLKTHGAYVYFESPRCRVLLGSFRIGGIMHRWRYGEPCPAPVREAIEAGQIISAHNSGFEYLCFKWLADNCGWPRPHDDQFRCTAATAAAMALPRALGDLAEALALPVQKDKEGWRLIRKFSIPRKDGTFTEPEDDLEDFEKFCSYCDTDVLTEAAADARMVPLSDSEQQFWLLTERINRRGIRVDIDSARSALRIAAKAKGRLDKEMFEITGGDVKKCSEPARLVAWVQKQGVVLNSAAKAEITDLLAFDDLPSHVRRALEIRQEAAKTSVSKLQAMIDRASRDGRVRGTAMYHAASTGRTQSAGVNFSNLNRPRREFDEAKLSTRVLFDAFRREDPDFLQFLYGPTLGRPLHLISDAIRGFIWAAPGHELVQADYSGIEGMVIAWLSGEDWKVQALHEILADPSLPDMYRRTAASIMNTTTDVITKKHPLRQSVGKVSELALGFGGGVSAFYSMSRNYGVKLDALYEPVWGAADEERREKAVKRYEGQAKRGTGQTDVLSREAWIACEIIKHGWRQTNPAIAQSWHDLEAAVREAVENPGQITEAAKTRYVVRFGFLWALLPSGRCLAYGAPRLKEQVWAKVLLPDGSWSESEVMGREEAERAERKGEAKIEGRTSDKVTVMGTDSQTKKWRRFGLYGGLIAENNTQATARDLLVNGMWKAERAGYPIIATVYDEIICEVPRGFGDLAAFEKLICELPDWAAGMPLSAGGWRGKRYRKD
jgi:DNA polymerase bacteriophage-type